MEVEKLFGENNRFDYLISTIKRIIELTREKNAKVFNEQTESNEMGPRVVELMSVEALEKMALDSKPLREYLLALDKEKLEVLITIMYIGKDTTYADEYGFYNFDSAHERLNHIFAREKIDIAYSMASKGNLDDYLISGCKKLNIKL